MFYLKNKLKLKVYKRFNSFIYMDTCLQDRLKNIQIRVGQSDKNDKPESNRNQSIEEFIDSKRINIYSRPWNKLEIKLKKTKLLEFISQQKLDNEASDKTIEKLKSILIRLLVRGKINKASDLNYDTMECKIISIKNLNYDSNNNTYKWKTETII